MIDAAVDGSTLTPSTRSSRQMQSFGSRTGRPCVATAQTKPVLAELLVSASQSPSCLALGGAGGARRRRRCAAGCRSRLGGWNRHSRDGHSSAGELTWVPRTLSPRVDARAADRVRVAGQEPAPTTPATSAHSNKALIRVSSGPRRATEQLTASVEDYGQAASYTAHTDRVKCQRLSRGDRRRFVGDVGQTGRSSKFLLYL